MKIIKLEILNAADARVIDKKNYFAAWEALSYPVKVYGTGKQTTIYKSFVHRGTGKFPAGLIPTLKSILENKNFIVRVKRPKYEGLISNGNMHSLSVSLEDYQRKMLHDIENKHRGIIISPTASGKTIMIASIISNFGMPKTLVIVPTRDLFYQLSNEFKRLLSISKVGLLGDGQKNIEEITIALYQTLIRNELNGINDYFDMVIADEVHASRSESYQIILNQLPDIYYRYGFTGTMRLGQPDRYIIQGLFGKPISIVTEKETDKRVTDVKLYMVRYEGMFSDYYSYHDKVVHNIWTNQDRNNLIADIAGFMVNKTNMNCLILVEKYMQAESIQNELKQFKVNTPILWNKTSNEDREHYKDELDKKKLMCLIATSAISVGTDIPNVESIIIGSEIKNWVNLTQKIGRGRRKTKRKNILYAIDIFNSFKNGGFVFTRQSLKKKKVYEEKKWLQGIVELEKFKEEIKHETKN